MREWNSHEEERFLYPKPAAYPRHRDKREYRGMQNILFCEIRRNKNRKNSRIEWDLVKLNKSRLLEVTHQPAAQKQMPVSKMKTNLAASAAQAHPSSLTGRADNC
jgi:hypothetical protein